MLLRFPKGTQYSTIDAAAFDLVATEFRTLPPGEFAVIHTGCFIESSHAYECLLVLPRSGLAAKHGVTVLNSPGLIDSDYKNEIGVILINHGKEVFTVMPGMRIAQGFPTTCNKMKCIPVATVERTGGFGSSGI